MRWVVLAGVLAVVALTAACTPNDSATSPKTSAVTRTSASASTSPAATSTSGSPPASTSGDPNAAISAGPTTAASASNCPYLALTPAIDGIGMRLSRITVLRSGGKVVGCRFYAVQGTSFTHSENLPGPHQPAIQIETTRYRSALAAHNAFVLLSRRGHNPLSETIGRGNVGVCFQTAFYEPDGGRDWACAFSVGRTAVVIRTVVTSPALTVVAVARIVARHV